MANRFLQQFRFGFEKMPVDVYAVINIGASGAPTLEAWTPSTGGGGSYAAAQSTGFRGVKSIVRNGTGDYTLTLQDSYQRLVGFDVTFQSATTAKAVAPIVSIQGTGTTLGTSTGGTIRFFTQSAANTAADPASGEVMLIHVALQNSTAQ
jgi:hypothetical protein